MYKIKRKLQKDDDNVVKRYSLIDNKSIYNIEYRYIEKDLEIRYLSLYIKLKNLLSMDVITIIYKYLVKLNYIKYFIPHYECLCLIDTKNYHKIPIYKHWSDRYIGFNSGYEIKFTPNCFVCSKGKRCDFLDCKLSVLNSNYCRLHMNCKCGYNRRLESCKTKHV